MIRAEYIFGIESIAIEPVSSAAWTTPDAGGDNAVAARTMHYNTWLPHVVRIAVKHTTFYFAARRREMQLELLEAMKALEMAESARKTHSKDKQGVR